MEELESPLSVQNKPKAHSRSPHNTCLVRKRPTKKSKDALSAEACTKPEVSMKIKLPSAYIRRRKQKKKTRSLITHALASGGGNLQLVIKSSNPGGAFHFLGVTHNDYFFRSGLEELIQHLTENYRNRYGTPLASKFDVEGLGLRKVVSFSFPQVATMCKERLHEIMNEEMDHEHENLEWKLTMKNEFARMDDKVHCLSQSNQTFTCRCDFKLLTAMPSSPSPHQTNSLSPTATAPTSYSTTMAPPSLSPPITSD
ncbi:hypothetical protein JHK82_019408 [Glycine max]|nr:hypothetical protein JHK82_019408 [Glycine max]